MTTARLLARLGAAAALATAAACGPARDTGGTPDSSPGQAGAPVPPPAGATAAARPDAALPETTGATTAATPAPAPAAPAARKPTAARPGTGAKAPGDTLEYDRAIEYKPDPRRELPAVGETKKP